VPRRKAQSPIPTTRSRSAKSGWAPKCVQGWRQHLAGDQPSHIPKTAVLRDVDFGHGLWTPGGGLGAGERALLQSGHSRHLCTLGHSG
jgi:hypothetical protein